jgi:hypothetical protein
MQLADHTSYVYNQIFHSRNVRIVAKARISFVRCVRQSARIRAVLTGRISVKFDTVNSSEDLSRNPCLLKPGEISGTLRKDVRTIYCYEQ